jgi:hypothetical protein
VKIGVSNPSLISEGVGRARGSVVGLVLMTTHEEYLG